MKGDMAVESALHGVPDMLIFEANNALRIAACTTGSSRQEASPNSSEIGTGQHNQDDWVALRSSNSFLVPLPFKPEQEAIAEALSDADALIESLEQLLGKKRLLKQGAMQELLTGKKRLPGFSGEWEVKRLGELGQLPSKQRSTKDEAERLTTAEYLDSGEIYTRHTH